MTCAPTWRDLYHEEVDNQTKAIKAARDRGQTWLVVGGRTFDPTRLGEFESRRIAVREAERIVNLAINSENAQRRRAGRPDEVIADSV
ncbi:hypothetical protein OV203_02475 [Nannocystis sp. ILAH1]|uniref:hypothetical protein n=1 Tax=Nannocystis sp. ILAH1 TaxID=2996789 RepID=UPI00226ED479|nr:hypothetical protein [Nannocystis sp. ILAH1]MCY0985977.1 hypothetical protein [Nannocystis sp. ILAH1]